MKRLSAIIAIAVLPCVAASAFWETETVQLFETLPLQDGGRVKPMDTFAQFTLLRLAGKREIEVGDAGEKEKINSSEWMLDVMFRPELAKGYPSFIVDNSDAILALGLTPHQNDSGSRDIKRGRYSYNELEPARKKLSELRQKYSKIKEGDRDIIQRLIVDLGSNVSEFEFLVNSFNFAREPISFSGEGMPDKITGGAETVSMTPSKFFRHLEDFQVFARNNTVPPSLEKALGGLEFHARVASALAIIPPSDPEEKEWGSPGKLILDAFSSIEIRDEVLPKVIAMEELAMAAGEPEVFKGKLKTFHDILVSEASGRGDYRHIVREVKFYDSDFFTNALVWFIFVFLISITAWFAPQSRYGKVVNWGTIVLMLVPVLYLTVGIIQRCIIRGRPPVSTLYETILFITAIVAIVALIIELMVRKKVALPVGAFLGMMGMFLSIKYEMKEAVDTMPSLVAVLDTNFWLSTHVTTVVIGYASGLLAMAFSLVYFLVRTLDWRRRFADFYKTITRMAYGVICFGLFFALVGTILGGIWANYSWGRFWGWDPKENGALMIVLWQLVILHSRMGGYIRELGFHQFSLLGGIVIAFSWWHVNLLEVGLHSYGFTSGLKGVLFTFYGIIASVMAWGFVLWLITKNRKPPNKEAAKDVASLPGEAIAG